MMVFDSAPVSAPHGVRPPVSASHGDGLQDRTEVGPVSAPHRD
jgi:hypothetical protein